MLKMLCCKRIIFLLLFLFCAKISPITTNESEKSENLSEDDLSVTTLTVKPFTRSRFNLRLWSTTIEPNSTTVKVTEKPNPSGSGRKQKRTRTTTTTEAPTSTTEHHSSTEPVTTTTEISTSTLTEITSSTTTTELLPTTTTEKLSTPGCGLQYENNYPWVAVLEHTDPNGRTKKKTLSKGVLIDPHFVLTTISSLHNTYPFWVVSRVRLGDRPTWSNTDNDDDDENDEDDENNDYNFNSSKNLTRQPIAVEIATVFKHEKKDLALIKLVEPITISDSIRPICLPSNDEYESLDLQLHMCKKLKNTFQPQNLNKFIAVTPVKLQDCHIMFRRRHALFSNKELCAWDEEGDSCTGDLGGPLMAKSKTGRYHLIGLKSYAQTKKDVDLDGLPGVYTRIGSYLKWLRAAMHASLEHQ
uniref:Putative hemolymph proteinase 8 hemolymph proteinase 8 n=1 Tax=Corethrella appendiculata TaxID=1370023 RepID=U5ERM7_9DIPT